MQPPALELRDVSKRFGPRWAISRLTYSLSPGRSLLLTGHNGSGKTTLLRMIATATFPTLGGISLFGQPTREARAALRPRVGLLSHANHLYEDLTALQNLALSARLLGLPAGPEAMLPLLERVGLASRAHGPVRQFSAGMRKRVAIARLLLKAPELVLLDEPFGELDPAGIAWVETLIGELKARGATVILATHLVDQGLSLTDERLHLDQGRRAEASA